MFHFRPSGAKIPAIPTNRRHELRKRAAPAGASLFTMFTGLVLSHRGFVYLMTTLEDLLPWTRM